MNFEFTSTYRRYVLFVLTLVYTLSYLDRGLIILLLQPIKEDLHLSDTQLGTLTGIAFGLFYATLGLPLARWSDRGNRVTITSAAIALWGITVMLCPLIRNYAQLLVSRVAAAVGEAGAMPPTYSLVGDYFPGRAERTRAMSIYWLASPVAGLIAFIAGGWLNDLRGWRIAFFVMGVPALLMTILVKLTVVEPRTRAVQVRRVEQRVNSARTVFDLLWRRRSARHIAIALILLYTMGAGLGPWYAAFMIRSHGMNTSELGIWLGLIFGCSGMAGILAGGYISSHWFGGDERGQLRLCALVTALLLPCFLLFLLLPERHLALIALIPLQLLFNFFLGPIFSLLQRLVPDSMRATSLAVVMLLANLFGMGAGPQLVGILSDALRVVVGNESLRYALLLMSSIAVWAAGHLWVSARTVGSDLMKVSGQDRPHLEPLPTNSISEGV